MSKGLLLDTDVVVDYLRGHRAAFSFVRSNFDAIAVSAITVAEIAAGIRGDQESRAVEAFWDVLTIHPVTKSVASSAGRYMANYRASHGIGLADAVIAATAAEIDADLKTLNLKHYPMFPKLKRPYRR